jgi:hypothetical protein
VPHLIAQPAPTPLFEFHSSFWVNLHLFLYQQALSKPPVVGGSSGWQGAVEYYRQEVISHNLLSREMEAIGNALSAADQDRPVAGLDPRLVQVLNQVASEYRERWWPEHDRTNRRWIEAARPWLLNTASR